MKNLREIIGNQYIKKVKKEKNKTFEFYAFVGYKPIIKELIMTKCHNGFLGCFRFMFIEKNKPKIIGIIRNKDEIETVAYLIEDSWVIGNVIPEDKNHIGNMGFYTRPQYRGNGNVPQICNFFENEIKKLHNMKNYHIYIQSHVVEKFSSYFKTLIVKEMFYGENSCSFFNDDIGTKSPFSVDLQKEYNKFMMEFLPKKRKKKNKRNKVTTTGDLLLI